LRKILRNAHLIDLTHLANIVYSTKALRNEDCATLLLRVCHPVSNRGAESNWHLRCVCGFPKEDKGSSTKEPRKLFDSRE